MSSGRQKKFSRHTGGRMKKKVNTFMIVFFLFGGVFLEAKKIGIIHYRVGRTDGVSLEIEKRQQVLQSLGHQVRLISGPVQSGADFVIEELEFERDDVKAIRHNSFVAFERNDLSIKQLQDGIESLAEKIETAFLRYHQKERFDALLIHNVFSLALHLPASLAFARVIEKIAIPIIVTHHDFFWERDLYQKTTNAFVKNFLEHYVPFAHENVTHICINSLAQQDLRAKRKIESLVFPDVFDFNQSPWIVDEYNADFLQRIDAKENDLIVLQATRIVPRKGIELAVQFVEELERQKERLVGTTLYNGKKITQDSSIVFVLAGYPEKFAHAYVKKLNDLIVRSGINARFVFEMIDAQRCTGEFGEKKYSLWDAYVFADIVTYPSLWEGWGNQFIEAVFAQKPIVLFEYPVFEADIKKEGYQIISLGNDIEKVDKQGLVVGDARVIKEAVEDACFFLTKEKYEKFLLKNFEIGSHYHGHHVLRDFLKKLVC